MLEELPTLIRGVIIARIQCCVRAIFILLLGASAVCQAQNEAQEKAQEQLQEIKSSIDQTSQEVESRRSLEKELKTKIESAKNAVDASKTRASELEKESQSLIQRRNLIATELRTLQNRQVQLEAVARKRLALLYMRRSEQGFEALLTGARSSDPFRHALFSARVRKADLEAFRELRELGLKLENQRHELDKVSALQNQTRTHLEQEQRQLAQRMSEYKALMTRAQSEKVELEAALLKLQAQALRIETVLSSIMSGPQERTDLKRGRSSSAPRAEAGYDGAGLSSLRGKLSQPVLGTLVVPFAAAIEGVGAKQAKSKGLELLVETGASVRAVADGKVAFVGALPTAGNVLILDHGKRSYSMYGRLAEISVERGDGVDEGQKLGKSSQPDLNGSNFYFEIRVDGKPTDPQRYLASAYSPKGGPKVKAIR